MAAEKGRSFLVKRGDGATSESFTTIAGMRETSLSINGETVDITNKDSGGWQTLLAGAGTTSVSVSGSGVFTDTATEVSMQTSAMNKTIDNYEIVFESGDKFSGAFAVSSCEYSGAHNNERSYSLSLESSGQITFTAA